MTIRDAMRAGPSDYCVKSNVNASSLPRWIIYADERRRVNQKLSQQQRLQALSAQRESDAHSVRHQSQSHNAIAPKRKMTSIPRILIVDDNPVHREICAESPHIMANADLLASMGDMLSGDERRRHAESTSESAARLSDPLTAEFDDEFLQLLVSSLIRESVGEPQPPTRRSADPSE